MVCWILNELNYIHPVFTTVKYFIKQSLFKIENYK